MKYPLAILLTFTAIASRVSAQDLLFTLTSPDPTFGFGGSVAISGDRALVGTGFGGSWEAAFVFAVTTGQELTELAPPDGPAWGEFGRSVALAGDLALVGAPYSNGTEPGSGSAYLFDLTNGQGTLKLAAADGHGGDEFGMTVAISGDRIVIGSPGSDSAYVFDAHSGQELFKLSPTGGPTDGFGASVAVSGGRAIVGAPGDDTSGPDSGSAYLFDVTTGAELARLSASNEEAGDEFGFSVAISGDKAVVASAHRQADGTSGSTYVFDVTTGQEQFELHPGDGGSTSWVSFVAVSGDLAVVAKVQGFPWPEPTPLDVSANVYDVTTGQELYVLSPKTVGYGFPAVDVSGSRAIVGDLSGIATLFSTPQLQGTSICSGDGSAAPCPCGNPGGPGEGCANSGGGGGRITAAGSASASADELVVYATNLLPSQPALLFAGVEATDGASFGDGLRCAQVEVVRFAVHSPFANGESVWGPGLGATAGWSAGDTRYLQAWYRDPAGPCGSGFNLTNGLEVALQP